MWAHILRQSFNRVGHNIISFQSYYVFVVVIKDTTNILNLSTIDTMQLVSTSLIITLESKFKLFHK